MRAGIRGSGEERGAGAGGRARIMRLALWVLLGLALRVVALNGDGLWCDEGYTAWTAALPPAEHRIARSHDDAPPLFYALQRGLIPHLPPSEASVRMLSAAAGVAGIIWLAAAPPIPGLAEAPAAFLALGTYGVYYGRLARSYTLLMLWGLILMTGTHRFLQGKRRWLAVVVIAETLALWTHNAAAPLILGANLAWLLCGRRDAARWIAGQAAVLLLWLPYLLQASAQFAIHSEANRWIASYWKEVPLSLAPLLSLGAFTSGARLSPTPPAERWSYAGGGSILLAIAAFAAVLVLLVAAFRRGPLREALFCASFTLGPLIGLAIASAVTTPAYILGRTDAIGYGGFVLWAALGLSKLPRALRYVTLAILLATTVLATASHLPVDGNRRGNDREIGEGLRPLMHHGDWVVFVGPCRPSIDYYLSNGRPGKPDSSIQRLHYPAYWGNNPAAAFPASADSVRAWEQEAYALRERFESAAGPPDRSLFFIGMIQTTKPLNVTAEEILYPGSILAYALNGVRPLETIARARGDGMGVDWIVFRARRDRLIPLADLKPVETAP